MQPRTFWSLLAAVALLASLLGLPSANVPASAATVSRQKCHTVKKHGKRVRVCHTVKPAAKPTPSPTPKPTATPGASDRAAMLAAAVYAASDAPSRYAALLRVLAAVGFGVYTPAGAAIVHSKVPGLYLYDFQVRAMANALGRHQGFGSADVATFFNTWGQTADGKGFDPEATRRIVLKASADAAAAPGERSSFTPLLVRALGLHHAVPYDMLTDVPLATLQLDALQLFLIEADVLVSSVHELALANHWMPLRAALPLALPDTVAMRLSDGLLQPRSSASRPTRADCDFSDLSQNQTADALKEFLQPVLDVGKYVGEAAFAKWAPTALKDAIDKFAGGAGAVAGKVLGLALAVLDDVIGGTLLAYSIHVFPVGDATQVTHYGPAGHDGDHGVGGKEIRFQELVQNLDDYGQVVITCGPYAGLNIPPQGNLKGVKILWLTGGLEAHGTVKYEPADGSTGEDGINTLIFTPRNEEIPGIGVATIATGTATGIARYQSAFGTTSGKIAQYLSPKSVDFAWGVERHRPPGYKVGPVHVDVQQADGTILSLANGDYTFYVCGDKPLETAWNFHLVNVAGQVIDGPAQVPVHLGAATESSAGIALKPKPTFSFIATYEGEGQKLSFTYSGEITEDREHCPPLP